MFQDHNKLIGMILTEEEDLIENHKQHVNEIINIEKDEMNLISEVDKSGSDVESYIEKLDSMLL
jgi:kinesin family protein 2/24